MSNLASASIATSGILIEAEDFDSYGGWLLDSQFETQMGSPYLLAHGLGRPVADATTVISVAEAGDYEVWVRAKDWAPPHHPGRFTLTINGATLDTVFGANNQDWSWQSAGATSLPQGDVQLVLHSPASMGAAMRSSSAGTEPFRRTRSTTPAASGARRCEVCPISCSTPATSMSWWSAAGSPDAPRP